ncbi:hypothetical protein V8F06_001906 [Rhypophila decipiens]
MSFGAQFNPPSLPPNDSFTSQTVIVTGGNRGLGLEAARHFVQLGAAKVILGCRSLPSGQAAAADIASSSGRDDVCEVWELDLADFSSIHRFVERASGLERLDVAVANAGAATTRFSKTAAGLETTVAVNVVGTFLLAFNLLPFLRRSAIQNKMAGHLVVVSSGVHKWAKFNERLQVSIFESLNKDDEGYMADRYNVSKLLDLLIVRSLAARLVPAPDGDVPIIVNAVDPGLCKTDLGREVKGMQKVIFSLVKAVIGRTAEEGSRVLVYAATAGKETHGQYLVNNAVAMPSDWVVSEEGTKTQERVWNELLQLLKGVQPGLAGSLLP